MRCSLELLLYVLNRKEGCYFLIFLKMCYRLVYGLMQVADLKQKRIMVLPIFLSTWHSRYSLHVFSLITKHLLSLLS